MLGSYYLTLVKDGEIGTGKVFRDVNEALMAYQEGVVGLHAPVKIRMSKEVGGKTLTQLVDCTVGRVIFNQPIPQDLGYVDRSKPENLFRLEIEFLAGKKQLGDIIDRCIRVHGTALTAEVLDKIKAQGYKYSTKSAITVAVVDAVIPPQKKEMLDQADEKILKIIKQYKRGLISNDERYALIIKTWNETAESVANALKDNLDRYNPIFMMADSGARGSMNQIRQLAGMRGLIANTSGKAIEIPIRANYREGLNILEYFISSRGARKGLADTALRTADSGYLTRRLVDVSQDVIIRQEDCGTREGIVVCDIKDGTEMIEPMSERLMGRYAVDDVMDPATGELLVSKDKMMNEADAKKVIDAGITHLTIRTVLNCDCKHGVCARCYGDNLANGKVVAVGEAVGVIAAQSIGEPGTQLTMRTFHTGGIASADDITQGLPRVEELFEARKPKSQAIISKTSGEVRMQEIKRNNHVVVFSKDAVEEEAYMIPYGSRLRVHEGDIIEAGDMITEGSVNPHDVLAIKGYLAVQDYLIQEVQRVYRLQGVDINDKHIEVIVRQMMKKVRVEEPGSTNMLTGSLVDKGEFVAENKAIRERIAAGEEGLTAATCSAVLMGITKASLATDSFLSAASFQETTRVLTEAAIKGKVDPLLGLKENVIIGKLLPCGTGMNCYTNVDVVPATAQNSSVAELVNNAVGVAQ